MAMTTERTALVTGATQGIGAAIVDRLRAKGWRVVGIARRAPDAFDGAFYACDVGDAGDLAATLERIRAEQSVDAVVNNVGAAVIQETGQVTEAALEEMWRVNVRAAVDATQCFLPGMRARGWGRIVNLASGAVLGKPGRVGYAATKAALIGMTRTMAIDLAAEGVTANVVAPGQIETELFLANNPKDDPRTITNLAGIPAKRLGEPREVAEAVAFFLSDAASYVTGQTLYVCGGLTVGKSPI